MGVTITVMSSPADTLSAQLLATASRISSARTVGLDARTAAKSFLASAQQYGFAVVIKSDSIVAVTKRFAPGDLGAFAECDCYGPLLLAMVPLKGGSVWGTDGASVGGVAAVNAGCYTLNKSGQSGKRFVSALRAAMEVR